MSSEQGRAQARVNRLNELLERHMAETKEPDTWPATVACKCGMKSTAVSLEALQFGWFHHIADEAEKQGRQRGFDEAKEMAMAAQCEGCRDKWPVRKVVGEREFWWHDMGNISRECTAAAIRELEPEP